ncbi:Uncharacterized protein DAT39_015391 [Clarias magur]|uniref:Uncharacterized protein n=1 Tax=Clarias magur TaxID=1594786 RepID=A0A8J4TYU2_CLAMG|nr:Uncharacterized protein DAT39_015391 [Clarias magur]
MGSVVKLRAHVDKLRDACLLSKSLRFSQSIPPQTLSEFSVGARGSRPGCRPSIR